MSCEKVDHNVARRRNDIKIKFDGDVGEWWGAFVDSYQQIAKDYNLSMEQEFQYLHNIFLWMPFCFAPIQLSHTELFTNKQFI